jgi:hypothetical protein
LKRRHRARDLEEAGIERVGVVDVGEDRGFMGIVMIMMMVIDDDGYLVLVDSFRIDVVKSKAGSRPLFLGITVLHCSTLE